MRRRVWGFLGLMVTCLLAGTAASTATSSASPLVAPPEALSVQDLSTPCGPGLVPDRTLSVVDFNHGFPYPAQAQGWGVGGTGYAHANESSGVMRIHVLANSPRKVYLAMRSRGTWNGETTVSNPIVWLSIPGATGAVQPAGGRAGSVWFTAYSVVDLGSAGQTLTVQAAIDLPGTAPLSLDIDDSRLYTCKPAPNARVTGDWTGEGLVDAFAAVSWAGESSLRMHPGNGAGRVGSVVNVTSGPLLTTIDWLGSPGDVTGDGRTDLLERDSETGGLALRRGLGSGYVDLTAPTTGRGWGGLLLATPRDLDLDGVSDLLAVRPDGTMTRYAVTALGPRTIGPVGYGWSTTRLVAGTGDTTGDRRGDLYAIRTDHCLYLYRGTAAGGLAAGTRLGCGWTTTNLLASPGDLDRDGTPDLLARRTDGSLWRYSLDPGGLTSRTAVKIGTGWNAYTAIA